MYSLVLLTAMTTTAETPSFGDIWAKHCFWECCLPARYGWVACGPGYRAYYPASYTSCCGYGGYTHSWHSACHGCYGSCYGCGGCGGGCYGYYGGLHHACGGGYYNCYGGGPAFGPFAGIGYGGFGAYGNFGNVNTIPFYSSPVFAPPYYDGHPVESKPGEIQPANPPKVEPLQTKPLEIRPLKTMTAPSKASLVVRVPAKAKVFIDDNLMHSTSTERVFTSPALDPGESYFYTLRVVVEQDGKEVEHVRRVTVKAGEVSRLAFDNLFDRIRPEDRTIVDASPIPGGR